MIGKMTKGQGMNGLLSYLLADRDQEKKPRERVEVIGGTVIGASVAEMSLQYSAWRRQRPEIAAAVIHESLRFPEGESPDTETQRQLGEAWAQRMGFDAYTIVSHGDHLHVAASRARADGSLVSTWQDWRRSERIVRDLESEFGLQRVEASHLLNPERGLNHRKAPSREQIGMMERTGKVPPGQIVAEAIDQILKSGPVTAPEFVERLAEAGIEARPNIASTGKLSGFAYEVDGFKVTAKAMGRGYTWGNLEKKGLSYEQARDHDRLREISLGGQGAADARDQRTIDEDRGFDPADRAVGSRASGADRDSSEQPDRSRRGDVEAGPRFEQGDQSPREVSQRAGHTDRSPGDGDGRGRKSDAPSRDTVRTSDHDQRPGSAPGAQRRVFRGYRIHHSVQHLAALAGTGGEHTKAAVTAWLDAMPATHYEIGLLRRDTGKIARTPEVKRERLLKSINWLRRENALGREILCRPMDTRYVLLDDVKPNVIERMKADGFQPAAVVETSPGNLQAWIRLPHLVQTEDRTEIGRRLATEYGADRGSVAWDKFGKLPGYTNRKPVHEFEREGRSLAPFVLLREAAGVVADRGKQIIDAVLVAKERAIAAAEQQRQQIVERWQADQRRRYSKGPKQGIEEWWSAEIVTALEKTGGDQSRADFRVARAAHKAGYGDQDVKTMLSRSPHVAGRDQAGIVDYADRTYEKAASRGRRHDFDRSGMTPGM